MEELMKDIVMSDAVQDLLTDARLLIEEELINMNEYKRICIATQELIDSDSTLLLNPIEVAMLIEEAIMIYSSKRVKNDSKKEKHFLSIEKSVQIAFRKQFGQEKEQKLN
ncbi:MAG: hypothetical protein K2H20_05075 [Bacilli bacterium]|nr:hypothetical protein [Bacilli bacterium]